MIINKKEEHKITSKIRRLTLVLFMSAALIISGCGNSSNSKTTKKDNSKSDNIIEFTDALGNKVSISKPKKVAVMTGSYADAWQLSGGTIAAATDDAKDDIKWNKNIVNLGSIKEPSVETMISANVDFAILSSALSNDVDLRETLENAGITTAYFNVETFKDYKKMMKVLTDITGRKDLYKKNVLDVQGKINDEISRKNDSHPKVLFLRAYSSGVTAKDSSSMTGKMLKELGCINIADSEKSLLKNLSMESIIAQNPDFIFVTTMGDSDEGALQMVNELLASNPAWNDLSAVKNGKYYVLDKELFNNKPNERWAESYKILVDDLYGK